MRKFAWAAGLLLVGCDGTGGGGPENITASVGPAPAGKPAAAVPAGPGGAGAAAPMLTAEGFGPLRIGMTRAES